MGRIKTQQVKRATRNILKEYPTDFKEDFNENKKLLNARMNIKSKKLRNVIAGYITRLTKTKKEL